MKVVAVLPPEQAGALMAAAYMTAGRVVATPTGLRVVGTAQIDLTPAQAAAMLQLPEGVAVSDFKDGVFARTGEGFEVRANFKVPPQA